MRKLAAGILLVCLAAIAARAEWYEDAGSNFSFATTFEGEPIRGNFTSFRVDLDFDPADVADASLTVTVDLAGADMGDPDMNAVLHDEAWFDVANHASAEFSSEDIRSSAPGEFIASGTLELKGVRRPLDVPFSWEQDGAGAVMRGEVTLRRTDFDVGTGEWATGDAIGLEVRLDFELRMSARE